MSKALPAIIALVVAAILQVSIAPHLAVFGVVPNIIFLVVVTLAFVEGPVAGGISGFVGGLVFDLIGTSVVGPYALVLSVVGYTTGMLSANLFAEGWILPVTIVAVASLSAELAYGIVLAVLGLGRHVLARRRDGDDPVRPLPHGARGAGLSVAGATSARRPTHEVLPPTGVTTRNVRAGAMPRGSAHLKGRR